MFDEQHILVQSGGCDIHAEPHTITWPDGTSLALHPVHLNGSYDMWRRAMQLPGGTWLVFDLRRICPPLRDDLMQLMQRDHRGAVYHRLRLSFTSSPLCITRIVNTCDMSILPSVGVTSAAEAGAAA